MSLRGSGPGSRTGAGTIVPSGGGYQPNPSGGGGGSTAGRFFADSSPWNTLAASIAEDVNSATIISAWKSALGGNAGQLFGYSGASFRPSLWTIPVGTTLEQWASTANAWFADNVPTPNFIIRSTGSEWHTVLVDTVRDMIFGVYYAGSGGSNNKPGTRNANGKVQWVAMSILRNSGGSGWWNYNSMGSEMASGGSSASMIRRKELFVDGVINHAMSFAGVKGNTKLNAFRAPATFSDGNGTTGNILEMGMRFAIKPSVSLATIQSALSLNSLQMIIVKALQDYGIFLCDSSSSNAIHVQNPLEGDDYDGIDPYGAIGVLPAQLLDYMHVLVPQSATLDSTATWTPNNPHH